MNKKFSTLLMGLAMLGSVSASAAVEKGKLHTVKVGSSFLTIEKTKAGADSLALVSLSNPDAVLSAEYKKTLWKFEEVSTGVSEYSKLYKITNYGTGAVLSLDLAKASAKTGAFVVADGYSAWNVTAGGEINITKDGKKYTFATATIGGKTALTFQKTPVTAQVFDIATADATLAMTAEQMNGLYNTPFILNYSVSMQGNPLNGVALVAENSQDVASYLNFKFADGKYLVVDTVAWSQATNKDENYWKLTTDAKPTETTTGYAGTVLANGRSKEMYAFKAELNVAEGYTIKITPYCVPVWAAGSVKAGKQDKPAYGTSTATVSALQYGNFAGGANVMAVLDFTGSNFKNAIATFGEAEIPSALDAKYTYYVKDVMEVVGTAKNKKKNQYFVYNACTGADHAATVNELAGNLWYLTNDGTLKNMLNTSEVLGGGFITLIDAETNTYAFGADTVQLTQGPKVAYVQQNAYKKVSKDDYVNGALSFMLKSDLADDLYLCEKSGDLYVEAADLADAAKFKVTPVVETETTTVAGSNGLVVYRYYVSNRLATKNLVWNEAAAPFETLVMSDKANKVKAWVAFENLGAENEYKIVFPGTEFALAAKAGSGVTFLTGLCDLENTTFVFAKKDAPSYGKPEIGHVKITTLEDDGKYLASQKDGYAALKAEGQSLKSEDVYTADTLTMWLDTACVKYDAAMPLYYISSSAFNAEGTTTRNYLMNTANMFDSKGNQIYAYEPATGDEEAVRAAYVAATALTADTLIVAKDTITSIKLNPAAVAFEVATEVNDETYRIISILNEKTGVDADKKPIYEARTMYLAHMNNVLYWTTYGDQAELFVIERATAPTANENIAAEGVTVIAGNGNITIAGAAGKKVVIANILGQTVANTIIASDNATIAAPAGVVVVKVEGEAAVKAIVK